MSHERQHKKGRKRKVGTKEAETDGVSITSIDLLSDIRKIIAQARTLTRRSVNSLQVLSNYLIGKRLVEEEQGGNKRAVYGKETLKRLSNELTAEFGRGYSQTNLEYMRKFYCTYAPDLNKIPQTRSEELNRTGISQTLTARKRNRNEQHRRMKKRKFGIMNGISHLCSGPPRNFSCLSWF